MCKYEQVYESDILVISDNGKDALSVELQESGYVDIHKLYLIEGEEYGYCSPRTSGAVALRVKLSVKALKWLQAELAKVQAIVAKQEKEAVKTATKKATVPVKTRTGKKALADSEDIEIVVESSRTNRKVRK